jgi:hypothetical protein
MTPDEKRMLADLASKIAQTPAPPRDPEAEEFIRTQIGKRPDALYLMTQTVLIQNLALDQARRQLQDLQSRAGQSQSGSFLNQGSSGGNYGQAPGQSYPGNYGAPQPGYAQVGSTPQPGGGAPSFLRGAAQTAAGVAAGALAFEGIRSLFSHPGYGGMGGYGVGGFGGGAPIDETVVNNYYDTPGGGGVDNSNFDLADNRDFTDTGLNDDAVQYDDASVDDASDFGGGDDDNFA